MSTQTKRVKLEASLNKLAMVGDVEGVAVVSRDGLLVASRLPQEMDPGILCSMSAAMHAAGEVTLSEMKKETCKVVTAESEQSIVMAYSLDPQRILVALFSSKANLGLIRMEMLKTADELRRLL